MNYLQVVQDFVRIPPGDLAKRDLVAQVPASNDAQYGHVDHSELLRVAEQDSVLYVGQHSMQITGPSGSGSGATQHSSVTVRSLPLLSVYTASKAAVNAFTESLALELGLFDVRVRLVLPGRSPETRFGDNARVLMGEDIAEPYVEFRERVFAGVRDMTTPITHASDVAEAVWRAVTDPSAPMRIPAGEDAVAISGA